MTPTGYKPLGDDDGASFSDAANAQYYQLNETKDLPEASTPLIPSSISSHGGSG